MKIFKNKCQPGSKDRNTIQDQRKRDWNGDKHQCRLGKGTRKSMVREKGKDEPPHLKE
jgi:hypothetical protein